VDADLIVVGRILTMEQARPTARAMAAGGGRVLAVGTEAQADRWRGKRTKVWRLPPKQTVVPGFVDSHAHLATDAWRRTWVDLDGCATLEEALDRLRARVAKARHGEWIVGRGWDESAWPVKRYLTRHDLDRVSVSHPILVNRVDGHMCSVNSAVLRRFEPTESAEGIERGPDGSPTGVLREAAAERAREAIPSPPEAEWADLLEEVIAHAHSLGITGVHDVVDQRHLRAYQTLRRQNRLAIRAYLCPYEDLLDMLTAAGMQTGFGDAWLRLGPIKVFADGSLGARTAALFDPYDDEPRATGQLGHSPKELTALLAKGHRAGFQLAVHAIGDRAIDVVVEAFGRVLDREPREDHRHRIEHFELPSDEALGRMGELGLILSMQPNFVARWSHPGGLYERRLGRERLARNNPFRFIRKRKLPLAFGSDGMPYGPLYGMSGAVDAPFASQRIPFADAIRAYTAGGAFASFTEHDAGGLAVGKVADFVVLSGDPARVRPPGLAVHATVVGGEVVHRRRRARGTSAKTRT
jgi:predicted amidohydrolase YtcJ